jgi:hypothetical protein
MLRRTAPWIADLYKYLLNGSKVISMSEWECWYMVHLVFENGRTAPIKLYKPVIITYTNN